MDKDITTQTTNPGAAGLSLRELIAQRGGHARVSKTWQRRPEFSGRSFSQSYVPTPDELQILFPSGTNEKQTQTAVRPAKTVTVHTALAPSEVAVTVDSRAALATGPGAVELFFMLWFPILVSVLSVCLTTTGLFFFAGWAGILLGLMFGLVLGSAVVVARNKNKGDTSYQALNTVFWMETGAFFLHCFTFYTLLPKFQGEVVWIAQSINCTLAAGCAAFAAFLSYRAVIMVRNYNAE